MHTSFFKGALTKTIYLRTSLKLGMLNQGSSFSSLKPLSASLGLCGVHFRWSFAALFVLLAAQPVCLVAQNIPPMIGDHVGKPKLRIPNPLENSQGNNQTSQSSQSGQMAVSPGGEREIHGGHYYSNAGRLGSSSRSVVGKCRAISTPTARMPSTIACRGEPRANDCSMTRQTSAHSWALTKPLKPRSATISTSRSAHDT